MTEYGFIVSFVPADTLAPSEYYDICRHISVCVCVPLHLYIYSLVYNCVMAFLYICKFLFKKFVEIKIVLKCIMYFVTFIIKKSRISNTLV